MSLFGSLFDENGNDSEDEDESANERVATGAGCSVANTDTVKHDEKPDVTEPAKPPAVRPEHGLCGILNRGATCYLNSLLQVKVKISSLVTGRFSDKTGHLKYRMQRIHRIQRIWRYRDVGVRGAPPPSARWRRLGPLVPAIIE